MRRRHAVTTAAVLLCTLSAGTVPAAAAPPTRLGPFEIDQSLLDDVASAIEHRCGVDVTGITGTGTIRFTQFSPDGDTDPVRGQGWFHLTVEVVTATGTTTTIRERSMDRYTGEDLSIVESTNGRATVEKGTIGHLDIDGMLSGRLYDVCTALA